MLSFAMSVSFPAKLQGKSPPKPPNLVNQLFARKCSEFGGGILAPNLEGAIPLPKQPENECSHCLCGTSKVINLWGTCCPKPEIF